MIDLVCFRKTTLFGTNWKRVSVDPIRNRLHVVLIVRIRTSQAFATTAWAQRATTTKPCNFSGLSMEKSIFWILGFGFWVHASNITIMPWPRNGMKIAASLEENTSIAPGEKRRQSTTCWHQVVNCMTYLLVCLATFKKIGQIKKKKKTSLKKKMNKYIFETATFWSFWIWPTSTRPFWPGSPTCEKTQAPEAGKIQKKNNKKCQPTHKPRVNFWTQFSLVFGVQMDERFDFWLASIPSLMPEAKKNHHESWIMNRESSAPWTCFFYLFLDMVPTILQHTIGLQ